MVAVIEKVEDGVSARMERHLGHPVENVWAMLTENDQLSKWFPELRVVDLREGGAMKFQMPNGTAEELRITDLKPHSVLEYDWWGDRVRFELYPEAEGCRLVLERKIKTMTEHTPKDIAGWHVCLDVIEALLDGKTFEARNEKWQAVYQEYLQVFQEFLR